MSTDNYASEEETRALIVPDTRTPAEKRLHKLIEAESVPELCGSDYPDALYKAAVKLAGQSAPTKQEPEIVQRVKRYAGQTMRTARNPNITARECIELAGWIAANTSPPAQPQQEPVAWLDPWTQNNVTTDYDAYGKHGIPLYTSPSARKPLTDEEIESMWIGSVGFLNPILNQHTRLAFARAIEAKHNIKESK